MTLRWLWLDLPGLRASPCGAVACDPEGRIVGGPPYFVRNHKGRDVNGLIRSERARGHVARWAALATDPAK